MRNHEQASESPLKFELEIRESRTDGLIFFDSRGRFEGCSPKIEALAGSVGAARELLEQASWPRHFAKARELVALIPGVWFPFRQGARLRDVQCIRTRTGFLAALAPDSGAGPGRLLADILAARVSERRALSRYLHGALSQDLVALAFTLSAIRDEAGLQCDARLAEAVNRVDRCCRDVRVLSYILSTPPFLGAGLVETIRWYGEVLHKDAGVDFVLDAPVLPADPPAEIKELFFAALQHMAAGAILAFQFSSGKQWRESRMAVRVASREQTLWMRLDCLCPPVEAIGESPLAESPLIRERARSLRGDAQFRTSGRESSFELSVPWAPVPESTGGTSWREPLPEIPAA